MTDIREPAAEPAPQADMAAADAPSGGTTHLGWALLLISVAQLMVVLDATIANIAKGGYILRDVANPRAVLIATGVYKKRGIRAPGVGAAGSKPETVRVTKTGQPAASSTTTG